MSYRAGDYTKIKGLWAEIMLLILWGAGIMSTIALVVFAMPFESPLFCLIAKPYKFWILSILATVKRPAPPKPLPSASFFPTNTFKKRKYCKRVLLYVYVGVLFIPFACMCIILYEICVKTMEKVGRDYARWPSTFIITNKCS